MMATSPTPNAPKASYEVETIKLEAGPRHKRLLGYYNEMHEAQAAGDTATIHELEQIVPPLLDEFEATECPNMPNPGWLSGKMRAGWHVARGDFETALKFEQQGYRHADEEPDAKETRTAKARRKSVSASNIADELWRLGRAQEGLPWARLSVELWPSNTINHLVLAITAYHAGLRDEANQIIAQLRQIADFSRERDVLSKCMSFERELKAMTDLSAVQQLLQHMGR